MMCDLSPVIFRRVKLSAVADDPGHARSIVVLVAVAVVRNISFATQTSSLNGCIVRAC